MSDTLIIKLSSTKSLIFSLSYKRVKKRKIYGSLYFKCAMFTYNSSNEINFYIEIYNRSISYFSCTRFLKERSLLKIFENMLQNENLLSIFQQMFFNINFPFISQEMITRVHDLFMHFWYEKDYFSILFEIREKNLKTIWNIQVNILDLK